MNSPLRRIVLVRHGETDGNSSQRLIGSGDPNLSAEGREQLQRTRAALAGQVVDLVVASPARRAFQSAAVLTGGATARLEPDFREIHFGRWEGRSVAEIESGDPVLYQQWRDPDSGFEYPGGELRAAFRARVCRGLERTLASGANGALVVAHRGVIREIVLALTGERPAHEVPALGEAIVLTRDGDRWITGVRSSNPPGLPTAAPVELSAGA
ncbi:MAG: histidine phosphatase family protein [Myxococcota bacterium]|jgi:broad specificity phosphatase PhoE|nr:histidine phosphatase family protein [Myxococcota bacterium]